jgi:hypothetical protein
MADGTSGAPGLPFASDPDTGFYHIGANEFGVSVGGTKVASFGASGVQTAQVYNAAGDLTLTPKAGNQIILDTLHFPAQSPGANKQFLRSDGSGNLVWSDRDTSGLVIVIATDTTYYVATTGSDVTGDGSSGTPWATVAHALVYLGDKWINSDATVTIQVDDGTYTSTTQIVVTHPCGKLIQILGKNTYAKTLSSVQSSSGVAGTWAYILNLNSVANIAVGDYVLMSGLSGGTRPTYLSGCHYVSDVDVPNTRITVTVKHPSASVASGAVVGTVVAIKTILYFSQSYGFSLGGTSLGSIDKLVLKGPGPGSANYTVALVCSSNANAIFGSTFGMSGWDQCISVGLGGAVMLGAVALSYVVYGINVSQGGTVSGNNCIFSAIISAVYASSGGLTWINYPMITGCVYGGYAECQSVICLASGVIEACSTYGIYVNGTSYCIAGSSNTFRDNGTNTSPALSTRGNDYAYIS